MAGMALLVAILAGVAGLFAFGFVRTRRPAAYATYKIAFYALLLLFLATLAVGLLQKRTGGYDPVPEHPRGSEGF